MHGHNVLLSSNVERKNTSGKNVLNSQINTVDYGTYCILENLCLPAISVAKGLEICIITCFIKYGTHSMFHNVRITVCKRSIDLIAIHCCVQSIYLQLRNILINA